MVLVISNPAAPSLREFGSWQFEETGNWTEDCARGRGLARQFLEHADELGFENSLGHIVGSIANRDLTGLEIGFLTQLSRRLAGTDDRPPLTLCSA